MLELGSVSALLELTLDILDATAWATDTNLRIVSIANPEVANRITGRVWKAGVELASPLVDEGFQLALAAHSNALDGVETEREVSSKLGNFRLHVRQLLAETGETIGTIGAMNRTGPVSCSPSDPWTSALPDGAA